MSMNQEQVAKLRAELPQLVQGLGATRSATGEGGPGVPVDLSLSDIITARYGMTKDAYFEKLGLETKITSMQNIFSMPDPTLRWLVPEIIREAIQLGMTSAPFFPNIIVSDQPVKNLSVIMPWINQSEASPARLNEGETIPMGTVSFGQKSVNLFKIGKGFKLTDEVKNYVSLDVLSIFVRDFGIQLGYSLDTLAMDVLINGNKADGSESAPVIGVESIGSVNYRDLLKLWVRSARFGRNFQTMISGEDMAVDLLDLEEFKKRQNGTTQATLNVKSPVPSNADLYIHHTVSDDQIAFIDTQAALLKLTAQPLMLETERIVSNQTNAVYASLTTGFSKMYQDATIVMDKTQKFTDFPKELNADVYRNITIEQ